jgi:cation transporter-like permease
MGMSRGFDRTVITTTLLVHVAHSIITANVTRLLTFEQHVKHLQPPSQDDFVSPLVTEMFDPVSLDARLHLASCTSSPVR